MRTIGFITLLLCTTWLWVTGTKAASPPNSGLVELTFLVRDVGGRVDWGPNDRILYDEPGADGWADVCHMKSDGTDRRQLTHGNRLVPQLHCGNPAWHPSGRYIVFQALEPTLKAPMAGTSLYKVYTSPGAGVNNNLWLMSVDGRWARKVTALGRGEGVLHPHFSHDGATLVWSQMYSHKPRGRGSWQLVFADVTIVDGQAALTNVRKMRPGNFQFYEPHSFFPDDDEILFTGMPFGGDAKDFTIYRYHLRTKRLWPLTEPKDDHVDEHAQISPDGKTVLWMSSTGTGLRPWQLNLFFSRTEYWMMNADGSNRRRLTWFNERNSAHWQWGKGERKRYHRARVIASDASWSRDGTRFVAYVQIDSSIQHPGSIVVISPFR